MNMYLDPNTRIYTEVGEDMARALSYADGRVPLSSEQQSELDERRSHAAEMLNLRLVTQARLDRMDLTGEFSHHPYPGGETYQCPKEFN